MSGAKPFPRERTFGRKTEVFRQAGRIREEPLDRQSFTQVNSINVPKNFIPLPGPPELPPLFGGGFGAGRKSAGQPDTPVLDAYRNSQAGRNAADTDTLYAPDRVSLFDLMSGAQRAAAQSTPKTPEQSAPLGSASRRSELLYDYGDDGTVLSEEKLAQYGNRGYDETIWENNPGRKALRKLLLGRYTDEETPLGTALQILAGLADLDAPGDIRDITYDLTHWEDTPEHRKQTLLDLVGVLPLVGALKYVDEGADLAKDAAKYGDEIADAAGELAGDVFKSGDALDAAIEEAFGDLDEAGEVLRKAGNAAEDADDWLEPAGKEAIESAENVGKVITEIKYKPSSEAILKANPEKTTTILGSYEKDMKNIIDEMGNVTSTYFGARKGGFNVLNVPDELYEPDTFWDLYNKPWLDEAINRGDDIVLATKPDENVLTRIDYATGEEVLTGFGQEIDYLTKKGYVCDAVTNTMKLR